MPKTKALPLWIFVFVSAVYLLVVFPMAYFRHDDWLILGNALRHLQEDWTFAFSPTLFFLRDEVVWFFRPMFKFIPFVFHSLFGLNYFLWLSGLLFFTGGALFFCYLSVKRLTQSSYWAYWACAFFTAAVHLHFGSVFWVGEGLMNCPQLFFLSLCTYALIRSLDSAIFSLLFWQGISWVALLLAIGFKESSIFHGGFLILLMWSHPSLRRIEIKRRLAASTPLFLFSAAFLYVRLFIMPINPYYIPKWDTFKVGKTVLGLAVAYGMPVAIWLFSVAYQSKTDLRNYLRGSRSYVLLLLLIAVSLLPYIGHTFFSPGWLLAPAYYLFFVMALMGAKSRISMSRRQLNYALLVVLVLGTAPVLYKINHLQWWAWKDGQLLAKSIIANAPDERIDELVIYNCRSAKYPHLNVDRVVGFEAGLYELWAIHHPEPVDVKIKPCQRMPKNAHDITNKLVLRWEFPTLTWVNKEALLLFPSRLATLSKERRFQLLGLP